MKSDASEWLRLEEELALKRARASLLGFITYMQADYRVNWHHRLICKLIDEMIHGNERRLIISVGPRSGKSQIVSRMLPGYLLGLFPKLQIIACSHSAKFAQSLSRDVQDIVDSTNYQVVFPATKLAGRGSRNQMGSAAQRTMESFQVVNHRGVYRAAGARQKISGLGADFLLIDDLVADDEEAFNPDTLDKQYSWYQSVARPRLSPGGKIIVVMTRWADGDLPGRLIDAAKADTLADQWRVINLPAINEDGPNEHDPRQSGDPLWPSQWPMRELQAIRAGNSRMWQAQYQGNPVPPGGSIIQESWWRYYDQSELPKYFDEVICSWDLSFTGNLGSDYTVGQVWGRKDGRAYLLRQFRDKVPFTRQIDAVVQLWQEYPQCRAVVVEQAANGAALIDALRPHIPCIVPVKPVGSKEARVQAITPILEAGNVFIPDPRLCQWAAEVVLECTRFPSGRHDDIVDCVSYGLRRLFPTTGGANTPLKFVSLTRRNPLAGM